MNEPSIRTRIGELDAAHQEALRPFVDEYKARHAALARATQELQAATARLTNAARLAAHCAPGVEVDVDTMALYTAEPVAPLLRQYAEQHGADARKGAGQG
jgi:hypothetical protein